MPNLKPQPPDLAQPNSELLQEIADAIEYAADRKVHELGQIVEALICILRELKIR